MTHVLTLLLLPTLLTLIAPLAIGGFDSKWAFDRWTAMGLTWLFSFSLALAFHDLRARVAVLEQQLERAQNKLAESIHKVG